MQFTDPAVRAAYLSGVRDAYQSVHVHVPISNRDRLDSWLDELFSWEGGEPPRPLVLRAEPQFAAFVGSSSDD